MGCAFVLLLSLPWIVAFFSDLSKGYLYAVGMWSGIMCFVNGIFLMAAVAIYLSGNSTRGDGAKIGWLFLLVIVLYIQCNAFT